MMLVEYVLGIITGIIIAFMVVVWLRLDVRITTYRLLRAAHYYMNHPSHSISQKHLDEWNRRYARVNQ